MGAPGKIAYGGRGSMADDYFSRDGFKKLSKRLGRRKEAMRDLRRAEKGTLRRRGRGSRGRGSADDYFSRDDFKRVSKMIGRRKENMRNLRKAEKGTLTRKNVQ